jgi:hypothetical protein
MNSTTSGAGLTHVAFFLPVALLLVREECGGRMCVERM